MKFIGCGSRYQQGLTQEQVHGLINLHAWARFTECIVGSDRGADRAIRLWADTAGIETVVFYPNFVRHGKSGGPRRNTKQLAYLFWRCQEQAETPACLVFPGGAGTADMQSQAERAGCYMIVWDNTARIFRLEGYKNVLCV